MSIKAILLDIDGTLYNSDKVITKETKEALLKVQDAGIRLILASGRTFNGLVKIGKELHMDEHHGLFVCYNGSQVADFETNEILFNQAISVEEGKKLFAHLKKFPGARPVVDKGSYMLCNDVFDCWINWQGKGYVNAEGQFNVLQYESRSNSYLLHEVADFEEACDWEINKVLTYGDPEYLQAHYEEMAAPFKDTLNSMFTGPFYYEFTAQGVDKTKAIDTALRPLGYTPDQLMAFGDAQNDKTMVMYAGIGVAMGNATDELKAVADDVTLSNDEDGIAKSLYKYLPEIFG